MCKETPKTKSVFVRVDSSSRADINASDYSLVPTSVLFERTPENILELAFQDGYCIFSINKSLNSPLTFFFNSAQLGQAYFTCLFFSLLPLHVSGNRRLIEQIRLLSPLFTVKDTKQNNR